MFSFLTKPLMGKSHLRILSADISLLSRQPYEMQAEVAAGVLLTMEKMQRAVSGKDEDYTRFFNQKTLKNLHDMRHEMPYSTDCSNLNYAIIVLLSSYIFGQLYGSPLAERIELMILEWARPYELFVAQKKMQEMWESVSAQGAVASEYKRHAPLNDQAEEESNDTASIKVKESCKEEGKNATEKEPLTAADISTRLNEFKRKKELGLVGKWNPSQGVAATSASNTIQDRPLEQASYAGKDEPKKSQYGNQNVKKWIFYRRSGVLHNLANGQRYTPQEYKRAQGVVNGFEIMHGSDIWA